MNLSNSESEFDPILHTSPDGINSEKVELAPFSEMWGKKFAREKEVLSRVLAPWPHQIEHIGSTSVQRSLAKPIIDIAVLVESVRVVPELIDPLARESYAYMQEFGLPGRHFFIKGRPRQFHLHIVDGTSEHWRRWLKFRDILRNDDRLLRDYLDLKMSLARKYRSQRDKYTQAKSDFINSVLAAHPD